MSDRIVISLGDDGVADVRLNRADKMNALDQEMFEALVAAGDQLSAERGVRAVVLSGEGRAFSAGLDFASFAATAGAAPASGERAPRRELFDRSGKSPANHAQRAAWVWKEVPVPVIAAIHGVAYGGGLQIALGADIRLVAKDARLSVRELHWGLIPDMSGTQTLRRLVRSDVARELTYTARIVDGVEAVALGLATRVSEHPREDALALAREIAAHSPDAVRAAKRLLEGAEQGDVPSGLKLEEELQRSLLGKPNQVEAVRANLEKRSPKFRDVE
jgi:enoyl-CoA hydratase/carnithine racemase